MSANSLGNASKLIIRGRFMKITTHSLTGLGVLPLLVILSVGLASAQTNLGKTIVEKLTAKITKLENA